MTKAAIDQDLTVGDHGWGKLWASSVWCLHFTEAHSSLTPTPRSHHGPLHQQLPQCVRSKWAARSGHWWGGLWKLLTGLGILLVYSILGELFFYHMQGSKTSVFIKDILFFRLEEITRKGITNKSLQREKKPATCSLGQPSWRDPEHWQPGSSPAMPRSQHRSLTPTLSMHHPLHSQPVHGLISPQISFTSRSIWRVLSSPCRL